MATSNEEVLREVLHAWTAGVENGLEAETATLIRYHFLCLISGAGIYAVSEAVNVQRSLFQNFAGTFVILASQQNAIGQDLAGEIDESLFVAGRGGEAIGMIILDESNHSHPRRQAKEHVVIFIGFDHEMASLTGM